MALLAVAMVLWPLEAGGAAQEPPAEVSAQLARLAAQVEAHEAQLQRLRAAAHRGRRDAVLREAIRVAVASPQPQGEQPRGGLSRYWDGRFYIASEDGNFRLNIGGMVQFRHVVSDARDLPREHEEGVQLRRSRLLLTGYVFDPRFNYFLQLDGRRTDGDLNVIHAWVSYDLGGGWQILAGQARVPLLREESISAQRQLAVERSYANYLFTADRSQQVQLTYVSTGWRVSGALFDGTSQYNTRPLGETASVAASTRAELLLAGAWNQFDDMAAWSTDPAGLMLGAGFDYEHGRGAPGSIPDLMKWTADASLEARGITAMLAVTGQEVRSLAVAGLAEEASQRGYVAQVSTFLVPDKLDVFARFEHIELGGLAYMAYTGASAATRDSQLNLLTVGGNYYLHKHDLKLSIDVVWTPDTLPLTASGHSLRASASEQVVVRSQLQWRF